MATSDKLNYLIETKNAIKNALVANGVEVSDTDTFRSYADKINNIETNNNNDEYFLNTLNEDTIKNNDYPKWIFLVKKMPTNITINLTNINSLFSYFPNLPLPQITFTQDIKYATRLFYYSCFENIDMSTYNFTLVEGFSQAFYQCKNLKTLELGPLAENNKITSLSQTFAYCSQLVSLQEIDASYVTSSSDVIFGCNNLQNFGGFKNLGMAYDTTKQANYYNYTCRTDNSSLTHSSLMNIINNLYDIAEKGCNSQTLSLGPTNKAKLTEDEIAIATSKGWTIS